MTRRGRSTAAVLAVVTCLLLSACGSQVPPNQFNYGPQGAGVAAGGGTGASAAGATAGTTAGGVLVGNGGGSLDAGSGGSAGSGSVTGSGSGSGSGRTSGGTTAGTTSGGRVATAGVRAGSCAGFTNSTGISDSQITIANIADLTGPVPRLFASAQAAVTAYVAYFNSTSSVCGRKLKLIGLDSGESESGDQQAATTACGDAFAAVGSMGAFDAGGASTTAGCGLPDLRTASTETARYKSPTSYGTYSLAVPEIPTAPFEYFKKAGGSAYKNAAFVYLNAGASTLNADSFMAGESKLGYDFKDKIAIDVTSVPNYNGYATQLKSKGIKLVQYTGAYQYAQKLKAAFAQQGYHPMFVMDPTAYDANYVAGGSAMNDTYVFIAGPLFAEAAKNPGLTTYLQWLQRTSGGAPSFFGMYAWSAAALFTQLAVQLGGKLTRASLLAAVRKVGTYTNNGMVPPMYVATKHSPKCLSVIQLQNGRWVRKTPYPYTCGGVVDSGVGD